MNPELEMDESMRAKALDPTALLREGQEEAGLEDYGDQSFIEPMTRWLQSLATEADLNVMGVMGVHMSVRRFLANRLRFQHDITEHPEIFDDPVVDPIVIVGLPRTGTTKLQGMMSNDPAAQKMSLWRILNPGRPPKVASGEDPRVAEAVSYIEVMSAMYPDLLAAHPTGAEEADEEAFMLEMTFDYMTNRERIRVPSYKAWADIRPREPSYEYLRSLLQYLQWQDGGAQGRPWILKSPSHLGSLDTLVKVFPEVTIVQCHRNPVIAMASTIRFFEVQRRTTNDQIDRHELGRSILNLFASEMERNLKQRAVVGDHLLDVRYEDICDDPLSVIRSVYETRGQQLSQAREESIVSWADEHPQPPPGSHVYNLEDYGLTPADVERAFAGYLELFPAK